MIVCTLLEQRPASLLYGSNWTSQGFWTMLGNACSHTCLQKQPELDHATDSKLAHRNFTVFSRTLSAQITLFTKSRISNAQLANSQETVFTTLITTQQHKSGLQMVYNQNNSS